MDMITGSKNERIKNLIALQKNKKSRTEQGLFVVEGLRIARDTVKSAAELLEHIYISESFYTSRAWEEYPEFDAFDFENEARVTLVKDSIFNSACETVTPQGILCVVRQPAYTYEQIVKKSGLTDRQRLAVIGAGSGVNAGQSLERAEAYSDMAVERKNVQKGECEEPLKLLILENIQDPGNLGTMIRTAEAAGIDGIIMSRLTVDIFSPKVVRSTMGAIYRMPFIYAEDFTGVLDRLKEDGVAVYAAYLRDGENYKLIDYPLRAAVMIGNEGNGLTDEAVAHASKNVYIPMCGEVESLNAAVAAALLMYEI